MMAEEWLSSKLKLCRLTTSPKTRPFNDPDLTELVINTQSYLQPEYDRSSIFLTMEAYSGAIYREQVAISYLNTDCRDHNIPESVPEQTDILHHFAEMLSGDILHAAVRTRGTQDEKGMKLHSEHLCRIIEQNEVTMANKLASEVCNSALEEVARHGVLYCSRLEEPSDILPKVDKTDRALELQSKTALFQCSPMYQQDPDMELDARRDKFDNTHSHARVFHDTCSSGQSCGSSTNTNTLNNMANMGSLDYPDAPPSTPLLPEMMKSRASFSRKLKGGLAMEFLPSPPPPTPKDYVSESIAEGKVADTVTDKSEFMVRLMRSLSLACSQDADIDEEEDGKEDEGRCQNVVLTLSDYAAQVSADIIHCISIGQLGSKIHRDTPLRGVQFLADCLAKEIVIMSIAEVMGNQIENGRREQHSPTSNPGEQPSSSTEPHKQDIAPALADSLLPVSNLDAVEPLRALAGRLIANILVQAFSELGGGTSPTSQQFPGAASELVINDRGTTQISNSSQNITKSHLSASPEWCNSASEPTCTTDSRAVTSTAAHFVAQIIAQEVLDCSIREASISLSNGNQMNVNSDRLCSSKAVSTAEQHMLRGVISDQIDTNVQELQCVLLWAAASHMGVSAIHLDLSNGLIQQQLCSPRVQAQFQTWTVGDLMTSVLNYCEDLQTASRGHFKSSGSLLGHLLLLLTDLRITQ